MAQKDTSEQIRVLLHEHKLESVLPQLTEMGVTEIDDLLFLNPEDLESLTKVQLRRFQAMVKKISENVQGQSDPNSEPIENYYVRYICLQPMFDVRHEKRISEIDPNSTTLQVLMEEICKRESGHIKCESPIIAQLYTAEGIPLAYDGTSCQYTLKEWFIENGMFFWVIIHRQSTKGDNATEPDWKTQFSIAIYSPLYKQSEVGMSQFCTSLRVVGGIDSNQLAEWLAAIRNITNNPPLILALKNLFQRKILNTAQRVAIQEGLYELFYAIVPADENKVFENSLICCSYLLEGCKVSKEQKAQEIYKSISLVCPISNSRLIQPVCCQGFNTVFDKSSIKKKLSKEGRIPGLPADVQYRLDDFQIQQDVARLLISFPQVDVVTWTAGKSSDDEVKGYLASLQMITPQKPKLSQEIKSCNEFKVFSPLELKNADFPCATYSKKGSFAVCTGLGKGNDKTHYIYDPITNIEDLYDLQQLAAKLTTLGKDVSIQPEISFKKAGIITKTPEEAIVVLLDVSASMGMKVFGDLSRLAVVKELFKMFADRSMAYNYPHIIGLTLFHEDTNVVSCLSEAFVLFQNAISTVECKRSTALWDAMFSVATQLNDIDEKYPKCLKRIICLTDGEDNASTSGPFDIYKILVEMQVTVDFASC